MIIDPAQLPPIPWRYYCTECDATVDCDGKITGERQGNALRFVPWIDIEETGRRIVHHYFSAGHITDHASATPEMTAELTSNIQVQINREVNDMTRKVKRILQLLGLNPE